MRAILVPVKSFREAKVRLAPRLDLPARMGLAKRLASIVLRAANGLPTYVACDDNEVADWAIAEGAFVLWTPGLGLSGAVTAGVRDLARSGFSHVVVAHADLPLARSLTTFGTAGVVTLAPDRRLDGTNVAAVPANSGFRFAYGPGSFARHRKEAARLGLRVKIVRDITLAYDLDLPSDLDLAGPVLDGTASWMEHALDATESPLWRTNTT